VVLVVRQLRNAVLGLFVKRVVDRERACIGAAVASVLVGKHKQCMCACSVCVQCMCASRRVSVSVGTFVLVKQVKQGKQVNAVCGPCRGSASSLRHAPALASVFVLLY